MMSQSWLSRSNKLFHVTGGRFAFRRQVKLCFRFYSTWFCLDCYVFDQDSLTHILADLELNSSTVSLAKVYSACDHKWFNQLLVNL